MTNNQRDKQALINYYEEHTMKLTFLLTIVLAFGIAEEKKILSANEHVRIEMRAPAKIAVAKPGGIIFFFNPIDGIHINTEPLFELKLDNDTHFEISGKPRYAKNDKDYLDIKKPVEFSVKAKSGTTPGTYRLKGKLYYFYCSDKEGWCNRFSQPVELTVTVTR